MNNKSRDQGRICRMLRGADNRQLVEGKLPYDRDVSDRSAGTSRLAGAVFIRGGQSVYYPSQNIICFDIGLYQDAKVWIIEANFKPSMKPFNTFIPGWQY